MRKITSYPIILVIVLSLFFNIERLDVGTQNTINIDTYIYLIGITEIIAVLYFAFFYNISLRFCLLFNSFLYTGYKIFFVTSEPLLGGMHTYVSITEFALLTILIWIAYQYSRSLYHFDRAVESLLSEDINRRILSLDSGAEDVQMQMHVGRRYNHPLSLVVVEPTSASSQLVLNRALYEAQYIIKNKCILTSLARLCDPILRRTDLMIRHGEDDRLLIACPMTDTTDADMLVQRIHTMAQQHGLPIRCGKASFPKDAVTFEELVNRAESNMQDINTADEPELSTVVVEPHRDYPSVLNS